MQAGRDAVPAGVEDTAMSPGGSWGSGSGALRTPVGPGPVKGQLPGYRDGASKDADASVFDASDSGASRVARRNPGRSGEIRNMRLSARHPPRLGGRKREPRRANPRAQQRTGADLLSLFDY